MTKNVNDKLCHDILLYKLMVYYIKDRVGDKMYKKMCAVGTGPKDSLMESFIFDSLVLFRLLT